MPDDSSMAHTGLVPPACPSTEHGCMTCSRAEWSEVGSEVSYNRCRYGVLHKGQLGLYQVGSPSLGQLVGADDIEKATVGWDVFRIAKLVDLKVCLALPLRTNPPHSTHVTCQAYCLQLPDVCQATVLAGIPTLGNGLQLLQQLHG